MHGRQHADKCVYNADSLHHHPGRWSDIRMTCTHVYAIYLNQQAQLERRPWCVSHVCVAETQRMHPVAWH